jgi:hypothetical protein
MLVVSQVERVLRGRLPAAFADQLLLHWQSDAWTDVNLARLCVLLCERAFDAGLEVPDLSELEQLAPALGDALHTEDTDALARLRLLWTLRMGRPWERCGSAATVFELAIDPVGGSRLLERYPDLLLSETEGGAIAENQASRILMCGRGVVFQDRLFREPPPAIEVRVRWNGYELGVGRHRFHFRDNPDALARRLERWFHYYFSDFRSQLKAVHDWRSLGVLDQLQLEEFVTCPDCGHVFQPMPGSRP